MRTILTILLMCGSALAQQPTFYAEIDANNVVLRVLVADAAFIAKMPGRWVQTSMDGSIRKNGASVGYKYDPAADAFIPPSPYPSWNVLNSTTMRYDPPKARPIPGAGQIVEWNEVAKDWVTLPRRQ